MIALAGLLESLTFAHGHDARIALLRRYFAALPPSERGVALGVLLGTRRAPTLRQGFLRGLAAERLDPVLFQYSHAFVGDLTETLALMWPAARGNAAAPALSEIVATPRADIPERIVGWLDACDPGVRLGLLKLVAGGSRSIVPGSLTRAALAAFGGVAVAELQEVWHALTPPYAALFAWLEGRGPRPALSGFRPFMLAAQDAAEGPWLAEPLWSGERVQVADGRVFSRDAEDITSAHPAFAMAEVGLDGVVTDDPRCLRLFDMLAEGADDLRTLPFSVRRVRLEAWFERTRPVGMALSALVPFGPDATGLMLKRPDSPYVAGRDHGFWVKRPHPPRTIQAVLLYVETGIGTLGLWHEGALVPVGQAPAAFLESWVREHTVARFGPVREVEKTLVVSVAYTAVRAAPRRKAGVVLVGAHIAGILPDRPAAEAGRLDALKTRA